MVTVGNLKMQGKTFVNVMKFPVPKTDESGYKPAFDQDSRPRRDDSAVLSQVLSNSNTRFRNK